MITTQLPTSTVERAPCPFGTKWSATYKMCIDDTLGVDRLTATTMPATNYQSGLAPMRSQQTYSSVPAMGDVMGTVSTVGMGLLNILTVIGAVGGLIYVWKSGLIPGTKKKRK